MTEIHEINNLTYVKSNMLIEEIISQTQVYEKFDSALEVRNKIMKAYSYAKEAHEGQWRLSGEPYIIHPVKATSILMDIQPDIASIQACLMHDVVEDTDKTLNDIEGVFGKEVCFLCEGMEKISKVRYVGEARNIGSLRKMFVAMAEDLRVIFIKLADRIHNMRTLSYHPKIEKRKRIALETLNIYAPLADRLGLFAFKNELEQECFKILYSEDYLKLKAQLANLRKHRFLLIGEATDSIKALLLSEGITNYSIDYRVKSLYSIYKKMKKKGLDNPSSLYDIFGIRIVVENIEECYRVLGIIHNMWSPLPNRFKDYIALPKTNGYKSLHTTVLGLLKKNEKQPAEIQIKTYEMKEYAEIGVAAHFDYKDNHKSESADLKWVKDLKNLTESLDSGDLMDSLKIDIFNDRIFVFTPHGDSINLPIGSTVVDFAYYLHTNIGNHISVAKVNSKVYPFDKPLKNGDLVEIITDKSKGPNPFWLSFIKSSKARTAVKNSLGQEDKSLHQDRGKEVINKHLEKIGLGHLDSKLSLLKNLEGSVLPQEKRWKILEQVGNFSITPASLIRRILRNTKNPLLKKHGKEKKVPVEQNTDTLFHPNIIVGGDTMLLYKLCYCCKGSIPLQIVGHINSKSEITIHNRSCKILKYVNKERLLPAYIEGEELKEICVHIRVEVMNKVGMLYNIIEAISEMKINIEQISQYKSFGGNVDVVIEITVLDYDYLLIDRLLERISLKLGDELLSKEILKMNSGKDKLEIRK